MKALEVLQMKTLAAIRAAGLEPVKSIQVRTSYTAGGWSGYGYVALVAHLDGQPKWVAIRNTASVSVLEISDKWYAGDMQRSALRFVLDSLQEEHPDAPVFGLDH